MTGKFETAGVCTGAWWSSSNDIISGYSLPCSTELFVDIGGFEWQNIETVDAKTYNESHFNTSTFLGNTNLDSTSQIYLSTQTNFDKDERLNSVRKEKLGDRITALQQLVSPFGKTDTASVLHDAIEYIKFLQEQITVSCNPHLSSRGSGEQMKQCSRTSVNNTHGQDYSPRQDLRSRGLCLMPISSTFSTSPPHLDTSSFWDLPS
ncbi:hypothetical protein AALP_AA7G037300 [Arabis alpina]|uniref:BHLH domain-containing protein n=1 Tax=Arabis alpina TaxID=50452 RepID=A0A087GFR1_ARAAL|nr:hypothetical protein AALP_AA7G037300 [Arabis alpina]